MRDPFDGIDNAPPPGNQGPRFRKGKYVAELTCCQLRESQKHKGVPLVVAEFVVMQTLVDAGASQKPGEPANKVFTIGASGWAGQYAMSDLKALIAAALAAPFESIKANHAREFCAGDGTTYAGVTVVITATDSDKKDEDGNPYVNLEFEPHSG